MLISADDGGMAVTEAEFGELDEPKTIEDVWKLLNSDPAERFEDSEVDKAFLAQTGRPFSEYLEKTELPVNDVESGTSNTFPPGSMALLLNYDKSKKLSDLSEAFTTGTNRARLRALTARNRAKVAWSVPADELLRDRSDLHPISAFVHHVGNARAAELSYLLRDFKHDIVQKDLTYRRIWFELLQTSACDEVDLFEAKLREYALLMGTAAYFDFIDTRSMATGTLEINFSCPPGVVTGVFVDLDQLLGALKFCPPLRQAALSVSTNEFAAIVIDALVQSSRLLKSADGKLPLVLGWASITAASLTGISFSANLPAPMERPICKLLRDISAAAVAAVQDATDEAAFADWVERQQFRLLKFALDALSDSTKLAPESDAVDKILLRESQRLICSHLSSKIDGVRVRGDDLGSAAEIGAHLKAHMANFSGHNITRAVDCLLALWGDSDRQLGIAAASLSEALQVRSGRYDEDNSFANFVNALGGHRATGGTRGAEQRAHSRGQQATARTVDQQLDDDYEIRFAHLRSLIKAAENRCATGFDNATVSKASNAVDAANKSNIGLDLTVAFTYLSKDGCDLAHLSSQMPTRKEIDPDFYLLSSSIEPGTRDTWFRHLQTLVTKR